jgi:hypothetical protein
MRKSYCPFWACHFAITKTFMWHILIDSAQLNCCLLWICKAFVFCQDILLRSCVQTFNYHCFAAWTFFYLTSVSYTTFTNVIPAAQFVICSASWISFHFSLPLMGHECILFVLTFSVHIHSTSQINVYLYVMGV